MSNLPFLIKAIGKAVGLHPNSYMHDNNLNEKYKSGYKELPSTDTALVCVTNDVLHSVDENKRILLVLLDLSAAFDTMDDNDFLEPMFR